MLKLSHSQYIIKYQVSNMNSKKVLLVEDDQAFVRLVQLALRDLNFDFEVAEDGQCALELLMNTQYDLVISDYRLPHIHGLKVIQAAKQSNPDSHIILISAATAEMIDSKLERFPLLGFVQKPFSPIALRNLVTTAF